MHVSQFDSNEPHMFINKSITEFDGLQLNLGVYSVAGIESFQPAVSLHNSLSKSCTFVTNSIVVSSLNLLGVIL